MCVPPHKIQKCLSPPLLVKNVCPPPLLCVINVCPPGDKQIVCPRGQTKGDTLTD